MEESHIEKWIVFVVAIMCTVGIVSIAFIVLGASNTSKLTAKSFVFGETAGLVLNFEGSFDGADDERGYDYGVSFESGQTGQAVLFNDNDTLYYHTDNNINSHQGVIEFWVNPLWNGDDNQNHVFFELGDSWFNRFRITKDGANNFRFMVWSSDTEYDVACNVSHWIANDWHQVRATWQGDSIHLDLDGVLCDTETPVEMPEVLSSRIYIGSSAKHDMQAQSIIDEFIIYLEP
jgi:hypothetical protein